MKNVKRNRPAADRRRDKKTASAAKRPAASRAQHAVLLPGVQATGETRASEVIVSWSSFELKTASETRHHSMPTPAELEAEGWVKFYADLRYVGAWMMARKI